MGLMSFLSLQQYEVLLTLVLFCRDGRGFMGGRGQCGAERRKRKIKKGVNESTKGLERRVSYCCEGRRELVNEKSGGSSLTCSEVEEKWRGKRRGRGGR